MYDPIKDGMDKAVRFVRYMVEKPPEHLSAWVHCYWELRTEVTLAQDFHLRAIPDACVNILFNQVDTDIAGVTALRTTYEMLNLGTSFHYVGIQLLPGVWQGDPEEIADQFVGTPYGGSLPLVAVGRQLAGRDFAGMRDVLSDLLQRFIDAGLVVSNAVTARILAGLDDIRTVADMAAVAGLSSRQLQRTLKQTTGFAPHDLLKVLRMQQSFKQHYLHLYADQSHYIHSFRKATGCTPAQYIDRFDV
ncbi:AraC family transcriptional regulator [Acidovorax sp. Leaf78]|uniref:helix-turn-helix domain-containing protein n=1 Tax=Acidovorax sp. Leaf78 TaxID=1736237 RepID=UPI0006F28626|nr:AraC family transcriptional regulator [Acidovorax sp. Leaf78]KQO19932.1 transcriptional regulator [Acidovorax sp. Leaf78]